MLSLSNFNSRVIYFHGVSHLVELFPAPIPDVIDTENGAYQIEGASDLMQMSHWLGTTELYLPAGDTVLARTEDLELEITATEFVELQLRKATLETLYYIINKTEAALEVADILDLEAECEIDKSYYPEGWLNEYDVGSLETGLLYLARLKQEEPTSLFQIIARGCLDPYTGLKSWLEENILIAYEARHKYDKWPVRIAVVFEGEFTPYAPEFWLSQTRSEALSLDDWLTKWVWVRNYDEA
jgi:Mor family transcriptional regulator